MNKIHRTLWNRALNAWVAVAEISRACGKRSKEGSLSKPALALQSPQGHSAMRAAWLLSSLTAISAASPAWAQEIIGYNDVVTVPGEQPSPWNIPGSLTIGFLGSGTLNIFAGGSVRNTDAIVGDLFGAGKVTVAGVGANWNNSGTLFIGDDSAGMLSVSNQGAVSSNNAHIGGLAADATGDVTVTGAGSSWNNSNALFVGGAANGTLTVSDGGHVSSASSTIGHYSGNTGKVTVSGAGSVWANQNFLFIGNSGNGSLTIANGGAVSIVDPAGLLHIAAFSGSTGALNIGAAPDNAAQAAGSLSTNRIFFGAGTGSLNFNHTETDYVFANALTGAGQIQQIAGSTLLTGNSSAFTGSTQIHGGSLSVNGNLGGSLVVHPGARLQGSGTVGSTQVLSGAVLAPGNTTGTLTVAGDLTFAAGAHYEVETQSNGQSDSVDVSGKATLGSAMLHAYGPWSPETSYTILTAENGIDGTFGPLSSNLLFLTPTLGYSAQKVTLTMQRNDVSFTSVGATANQRAVGAGLQTLNAGALYNAVVQLDAPSAQSAFEQLSGQIHASLRSTLVEDSRLVRDAATERLRQAQGSAAINMQPSSAAWVRAYGAWGAADSDGNFAQTDRSVRGILAGADQNFGNWRLGAFAGSGHSKVNTSHSSASIDTVHLGLYGGRQWGALGLRTGLAYAHHNIDTTREVAFTSLRNTTRANYHAQTIQLFGELGWQMGAGATALEPFANLAYVNQQSNGFTERGGASALTVASERKGLAMTTLGVRASTQWNAAGTPVNARAMLGWRHALGSATATTSMAFAGAQSFVVNGAPVAKNVALLELGVDMALQRNLTLGLTYSGQAGSDFREQNLNAHLLWKF